MKSYLRWIVTLCLFQCLSALVVAAETTDELLKQAKAFWDKGDYTASARICTKVIKIDPTCADGYYGRGMAYLSAGDDDAAIADFSETIRRSPLQAKAYRNRGTAYLEKGQMPQALSDLTRKYVSIQKTQWRMATGAGYT